jgi:predicted nucleic acid-binding protein
VGQRLARFDDSTVVSVFHRVGNLFPIFVPTANVFNLSFDFHSRFSLSHWDAMLLAACKDAGVTTLYSEDLQAGMNYDGVVIVNPFA